MEQTARLKPDPGNAGHALPAGTAKSGRLAGLQSLRALAAFAVVIQHVTFFSCVAIGVNYQTYLPLDLGVLGVDAFFVISGFVMAGCLSQGKWFLLHRILRIYPAFWLSIAVSFGILSSYGHPWTFSWVAFLLIPATLNNSWRVPYWTLVYEMAFYAAVYCLTPLAMRKKTITRVLIIWLLAVFVVNEYVAIDIAQPGTWIFLSRMNIYFIVGMLMGLNFEMVTGLESLFALLAAVILWGLGNALMASHVSQANLTLALAWSAVLLLAIRHLKVPWLEWLGDASYGIYLTHLAVVVVTTTLLVKRFPSIYLLELWLATLVISFALATGFGWFEHAVHSRVKLGLRRRSLATSGQVGLRGDGRSLRSGVG